MTDTPNVFTAFSPIAGAESIVQPGDVALLLKRDGSVQALNFGYDSSRLHLPEDEKTDDDRAMERQGAKLFALALAATHPQLMQTLLDIATDPEIVDLSKLRSMARLH